MSDVDGTAATDPHRQFVVDDAATERKWLQMGTFFLYQILIVVVVPHDLLSGERPVFFQGTEVVTTPQYQRLADTPFQMLVDAFNRTIFVSWPRPALLYTSNTPEHIKNVSYALAGNSKYIISLWNFFPKTERVLLFIRPPILRYGLYSVTGVVPVTLGVTLSHGIG